MPLPQPKTSTGQPARKGRVIREFSQSIDELLPSLPRATRADRDVVYVIQAADGGPVKIGHTTFVGVERRLSSLQIGNHKELVVRALFAGGYWLEQALHEFFGSSRLRGEWFGMTSDLVALCPELVRGEADLPKRKRSPRDKYFQDDCGRGLSGRA